ncbi:AAA domain-containing protein [Pseudoroseicyclus aestuarii]|uniref:AAA domain-containing protein n=2 Tax=Pseudoroseicyclus aestuarii TaxID=1795041 RepID=A0A318T3K5_9RHOB|nr:AAA domain-containing protein [Pseudoroseicyclus aestuarii]
MGTLELQKAGDAVTATVNDAIFHVFSEDFVQDELRERKYELDGEIENLIAVDSANIKLDDAKKALEDSRAKASNAYSALDSKFTAAKEPELHGKASIKKQLREYKALSLEKLLELYEKKPEAPGQTLADIIKDLDSLKAIPAEPAYPGKVEAIATDDVDLDALAVSLEQPTSPSSVSEAIKKKIDAHHGFYQEGAKMVRDEHRAECPFCEQGIANPDPKALIDAYIEYFEDEEEKHKAELREFFRKLRQKEINLDRTETQLARQKSRYDDLRRHVPSKKDTEISDGADALKKARDAIAAIKSVIEQKAAALGTAAALPAENMFAWVTAINKVIGESNEEAAALTSAVGKADEERRTLQRKACAMFEREFAFGNWPEIEVLCGLLADSVVKQNAVSELEKASPSAQARDRVAETFKFLLKEFFAEKYVFDTTSFALKRGEQNMVRGPHRTLSDGEKTAIAFCYFIACAHKKVATGSDYRKLFFVFDDPVTSMSYDFIFAIAQTLKNLNISDQGGISINPGKIAGDKCWRPELLLLTHSSYFFNISLTNRVVDANAAFALHTDGKSHSLARLNKYIAPFQEQLIDIHDVANGKDPDHRTANCVRSVLEAIGRFCRPDKSDSLTDFVKHLAGEEGMTLKSVLINSLCHGTYYDETPPPDDLVLACKETLVVVERYAVGQLALINKTAKA